MGEWEFNVSQVIAILASHWPILLILSSHWSALLLLLPDRQAAARDPRHAQPHHLQVLATPLYHAIAIIEVKLVSNALVRLSV